LIGRDAIVSRPAVPPGESLVRRGRRQRPRAQGGLLLFRACKW